MSFRPDPSFYPSPRLAAEAPAERHAYVAALDPLGALKQPGAEPDALTVVDLDPKSPGYGKITSVAELPNVTKELLRRGYSEQDIDKILGGNMLRVMEEVEKK